MPGNSDPTVEKLVAAGDYQHAAEQAEKLGLFERAGALYTKIWDYSAASRCAEEAGNFGTALGLAVESRDESRITNLTKTLCVTAEGRQQAATILEQKRRPAEAAAVHVALGNLPKAATLYEAGQRDVEAARVHIDMGQDNRAGQLLQRALEGVTEPPKSAEIHTLLGHLFARRQQGTKAIRHFQKAVALSPEAGELRSALIRQLFDLDFRDGARAALVAARVNFPDFPKSLEEFMQRSDAMQLTTGKEEPTQIEKKSAERLIGQYRVLEIVGSGAAGRVFKAKDTLTNRDVAVKLLYANSTHGTEAYQRFLREAKITEQLDHDNIVKVHKFERDGNYLVMEYMERGSLEKQIQEHGRLPLHRCIAIALNILAGLEKAHQQGVVHRDVKPANVFLDSRGTAKIGDFGTAHLLEFGMTQTGGLIGTLAYISPEQITGADLTVASDYYSFGILLFECLTGRLPFNGPDFIAQHLGDPPPSVSSVGENVPVEIQQELDLLLQALLTKDPATRLQDANQIRRSLNEIHDREASKKTVLALPTRSSKKPSRVHAVEKSIQTAKSTAPKQRQARYRHVRQLRHTGFSELSHAVDTELERSVVIEKFDVNDREDHLLAFANAGGPYLQRVLSYNSETRTAVYEAPTGQLFETWVHRHAPLSPATAAKLTGFLASALASLHAADVGHGSLDPQTILVDDLDFPTILTAGLSLTNVPGQSGDIDAVLAVHALMRQGNGHVPFSDNSSIDAVLRAANELETSYLQEHGTPLP